MNQRKNLITPENAASFIPVFISSGISVLLIIFFVMPQYLKSTKVELELNGLIKKKDKLENLKSEYEAINEKFDKLNKEKSGIINLITGRSNLDTLLAEIGETGKRNNIELHNLSFFIYKFCIKMRPIFSCFHRSGWLVLSWQLRRVSS